MTRSKRMQPVVNVTANREREAAQRLGECQQRVQAAEQRLEELIQYREEYTRQFANGGSLNTARLQDYRIFLGRLNQAVEQQHVVLERAREECAALRQRWLDMHTRAQALDKVVERYRDEERSDQNRRDQKETDEHGQTLRGRKNQDD
ncbi:MAG: flagellar export protein FliJ [Gammaproteobacteria bacterium]|nr:flagellar export protein FliJ [Gammaproteobacteria bacterium]